MENDPITEHRYLAIIMFYGDMPILLMLIVQRVAATHFN